MLPAGAPGRTAKRALAVFCMLAVLSPLFSLPGALFSAADEAAGEAESASLAPVLDAVASAGAGIVRREAEAFVAGRTDVPCEVRLSVHTEGGTDVYIDRITLVFAFPFAGAAALTEALSQAFGIPAGWEVMQNDGTAATGGQGVAGG